MDALTFLDCCVVPPEAVASYAQEVDEIVEALFTLFAGQDRLELFTVKRMRLPRNAGGFQRGAFTQECWWVPAWLNQLECEQCPE